MSDPFKAEVKVLETEAGRPIAILNSKDASERSIFLNDRIKISYEKEGIVAVVDLSENIPEGKIILFEEAKNSLGVENGGAVEVELTVKPDSIDYIKKKIEGEPLSQGEVESIIQDSVDHRLTDPELMAFTVSVAKSDFSAEEAEYLTRGMVKTGDKIDIANALDKHCIGGVPGNRTTPIIVPIIAAAGCKIPKTSSRAISSPAGTADTMEVLANVEHTTSQIRKIVEDTNGCITWGGAVNLAPADDEFIRVRKSLGLDPMEQIISSVLAKKKSVGSDTVLIDIPIGEEAKIQGKGEANDLSKYFKELGKKLDMDVVTLISDGSHPIGRGIGPALEARDVLKILESGGEKGPEDLREKSLRMADILLDEAGSKKDAKEILESGQAYEKLKEIINKQGKKVTKSDEIQVAENSKTIRSEKRGRVDKIHNHAIDDIARSAGCPKEKKPGVYLHKKIGDPVDEGDELFTIYSENEERLHQAVERAKERKVYEFKSFLS